MKQTFEIFSRVCYNSKSEFVYVNDIIPYVGMQHHSKITISMSSYGKSNPFRFDSPGK